MNINRYKKKKKMCNVYTRECISNEKQERFLFTMFIFGK